MGTEKEGRGKGETLLERGGGGRGKGECIQERRGRGKGEWAQGRRGEHVLVERVRTIHAKTTDEYEGENAV